jgi:adenine-specific DNA-methyltransferase
MSDMTKQKLELTWIGKEKRPKLEPRILLEDAGRSYHAKQRVSEEDVFDNRLIFGDNLLALKALEQEFAGKVKCVFIDPPYNTGSAFTHYDDGLEHSIWVGLMRDRLEIIKRLLADDGSLWITIDDNEAHYLKVLCDEIFGRPNFASNVVWQKTLTRRNDAKIVSTAHDHILVYAKNVELFRVNKLDSGEKQRATYRNPDKDPRGDWLPVPFHAPNIRPNLTYEIITPGGKSLWPQKDGVGAQLKSNLRCSLLIVEFTLAWMAMVWRSAKNFGVNRIIRWFLGHGGGTKKLEIIVKRTEKQKKFPSWQILRLNLTLQNPKNYSS